MQSFMDDEEDEEEQKRPRMSLLETKTKLPGAAALTIKRAPFGGISPDEHPSDVESVS